MGPSYCPTSKPSFKNELWRRYSTSRVFSLLQLCCLKSWEIWDDGCRFILIDPNWPSMIWFPELLSLLTAVPLTVSLWSDLSVSSGCNPSLPTIIQTSHVAAPTVSQIGWFFGTSCITTRFSTHSRNQKGLPVPLVGLVGAAPELAEILNHKFEAGLAADTSLRSSVGGTIWSLGYNS